MNADEHPAAVMRRAAALLRERAQAAKELTGDGHGGWYPWSTVRQTEWRQFPEPREVPGAPYPFGDGTPEMADGRHEPTGEAFVAYAQWTHDEHEDWHDPEFFAGPMPEALAGYIASMHPGFALAVADWLDVEAEISGRGLPDESGTVHAALRIALVYLGETGTEDAR